MSISYVKEVQDVIDLGIINAEQTMIIYNELIRKFDTSPDASQTQASIYKLRKNERNYYHELIDEVCKRYDERLSWRQVKFEPSRVKRCVICQSYFYDVSRNGKRLTCDLSGEYRVFDKTNRIYRYYHKNGVRLSFCAVEYDQRRRAAPKDWTEEDIIYPHSRRRVQEVGIDERML